MQLWRIVKSLIAKFQVNFLEAYLKKNTSMTLASVNVVLACFSLCPFLWNDGSIRNTCHYRGRDTGSIDMLCELRVQAHNGEGM